MDVGANPEGSFQVSEVDVECGDWGGSKFELFTAVVYFGEVNRDIGE